MYDFLQDWPLKPTTLMVELNQKSLWSMELIVTLQWTKISQICVLKNRVLPARPSHKVRLAQAPLGTYIYLFNSRDMIHQHCYSPYFDCCTVIL